MNDLTVTNPGVRTTRPGGYNPYSAGGVEVIPRRMDLRNGVYTPLVGTASQMRSAAFTSPMRVLQLLGDIDPLVSKAQRNTLTLTCAPGDVKFIAVKETQLGAGDDSTDDAETGKLKQMWKNLPREVGGLKGLRKSLTKMALFTGMICMECVPGPTGTGLAAIYPVDPLTIYFARKTPGGPLIPYQRIAQGGIGYSSMDIELDPNYFLWIPIDPDVDNPYGRAVYSAALPEVLANMTFNQDLRDGVHNSAWKRLVYKYSYQSLWDIATKQLMLPESRTNPQTGLKEFPASDWVNGQLKQIDAYLSSLRPDDNLKADGAGGGVDSIDGANLGGIEPVIANQRLRVIQALDETPTMMGVEGASFNFGSVAWAVRAQGLEDLRDDILQLLIMACNLHLRLLGLPLETEIEVEPIRTTDKLVDAKAVQVEIANELTLVDRGYTTDETASVKLTGTGVADPEKAKKASAIPAPIAPDPAEDPGLSLPPGSTAEERGAGS